MLFLNCYLCNLIWVIYLSAVKPFLYIGVDFEVQHLITINVYRHAKICKAYLCLLQYTKLYSDCRTNFVSATRLLKLMREVARQESINWRLSAPNFCSLWEEGIKSVKSSYEEVPTVTDHIRTAYNSCSDPSDCIRPRRNNSSECFHFFKAGECYKISKFLGPFTYIAKKVNYSSCCYINICFF